MKDSGSITIDTGPNELVITVHPIGYGVKPMAAILNYSGEMIAKLEVEFGINKIVLAPYKAKKLFR
jgi:hypothetical protein